jgi:cytochrome c-type biogenesis protein CcmH/NrfG
MGIVTALFEGMESKYLDRLRKAQEIDPGFEHGAIDISWGRYYYSLPWPKYDAQKSEQFLQKALRQNPSNVRVRVYLADLFLKEGHPEMSKRQLQKALEVPEGAYDAAEIRRYQEQAREALAKIK